jgi:hypothetical protein
VCRRVGYDGDDERPVRRGADVVPELAQRDRGRHLLRAIHRAPVLPPPLLEAGAGRDESVSRHEIGAVGAQRRDVPLEQRGLADDDVDVEDAAAVAVGLLALNSHALGERLRLVREDQVVVTGNEEGDAGRGQRDDDEAEQDAAEPQRRPRVSPPSTAIVVPVT